MLFNSFKHHRTNSHEIVPGEIDHFIIKGFFDKMFTSKCSVLRRN